MLKNGFCFCTVICNIKVPPLIIGSVILVVLFNYLVDYFDLTAAFVVKDYHFLRCFQSVISMMI